MRGLVLVLLLLAAAKVGTQLYLSSTAKDDIIVAAYRERAVGACEQAAKLKRVELEPSWSKTRAVELVIGKASLDVRLWQTDHALWQSKFKNPYLFLTMRETPQKVFCEFDIVQGSATVLRM